MSNEQKTLLFMGDSIVNGFPFRRPQAFPSIIERELGVKVYNEGSNGETAAWLTRYFSREVKRLKPDMVFIMTGSNDAEEPGANAEHIAEMILGMAADAVKLGSVPVLLTPIDTDPQLARERWARGVDFERCNEILAEIGRILMESEYQAIDTGMLYKECRDYVDGVHPTPAGYRFIADIIIKSGII